MPKVILISGGSDGLGKAIAKKLSPNHKVVILAHNKTKLESAAKELGCDFVEAELSNFDSLTSAVNQVKQKYQTIDVLVNNAGIWMEGLLDDSDPQKIKELIDINTTGTIFLTKAVLPVLRSNKTSQIINIISQDGLCAKKNRSVYHASKWAITGFTKCLQEDLADDDIKVTGIYPGLIKTGLFQKSGVERDLSDALDPDEVASLVEYVINLSPSTYLPEVSIKNKINKSPNMDDTNAPVIDLNIDPDMITTQNDSPQLTPRNTDPQNAAPITNSNIIDITPGSTDKYPTYNPSNHIDVAPLPQPKTVDITPPVTAPSPVPTPTMVTNPVPDPITATAPSPVPQTNMSPEPVNITDITPDQIATFIPPESSPTTPVSPEPITQSTTPQSSIATNSAPKPVEQTTQSSPLAEDPDLVKLIK